MPLSDDAGPRRHAHRRVGHARAARRDRGRASARDQRQEGNRGVRGREIQPLVPRERLHLQDRLGSALRARRLLARLRAPLRHLQQRLHRDGVVAAQAAAREGAAVPGAQGAPVLPALRHRALLARAGPGLRDGADELGVRDVPVRGGCAAPVPHLDHDAVDAAVERGGRRASRSRVRRVRGGRDALRRGDGAGGRRARRRQAALRRAAGRELSRTRPRGPALRAPARAGPPAAGGPARRHHRGELRIGRRGHRARAHGPRVRRRRLSGRPAVRARLREPRRGRRHLPGHRLGGAERAARHRQGDEPVDHRAAEARGPLGGDAPARAQLSVLLALRLGAHLLRAQLVVRAHHRAQGAAARGECPGRLAPAGGRERTLRWVAREQRGLGAVARPVLGHAAQRVGVRPRSRAPRGDRLLRGARRALGREGGAGAARGLRSAPAVGGRCPRTSIRTGRTSTATRGGAPSAAAPCGARPR